MTRLVMLMVLAGVASIVEAKMQNVTVKGTTICHKKRVANVLVQLWERDTLDPNDLLMEVHSSEEGEFTLSGGEDEIGSIAAFVRITHSCDAKPNCERIVEYDVPKAKIGSTYDMTYVPLNIVVSGEKTKCK